MNWLAFALSLVGMLCVMLLWQVVDSWLYRRGRRLQRLMGSGLLLLAIAIPGVWLLPYQSKGVFIGALAGLVIAGGIDAVRRQRIEHATT